MSEKPITSKPTPTTELNKDKLNGSADMNQSISKSLSLLRIDNLVIFSVFYSPLFYALIGIALSFSLQDFKGFVYLGYLIGISCLREWLFYISKAQEFISKNDICTMVQYSNYADNNSGLIVFLSAFSTLYMVAPMMFNNDYNYVALGGLLAYSIVIIAILSWMKCSSTSASIINYIAGAFSGIIIVALMYTNSESSQYMFFNERSNRMICSMPKNQTFKCSVYKNGELVGSSTN